MPVFECQVASIQVNPLFTKLTCQTNMHTKVSFAEWVLVFKYSKSLSRCRTITQWTIILQSSSSLEEHNHTSKTSMPIEGSVLHLYPLKDRSYCYTHWRIGLTFIPIEGSVLLLYPLKDRSYYYTHRRINLTHHR